LSIPQAIWNLVEFFFFFSFQVTKMRLKPFFVWRTMCEPGPTRPSMDLFTSNTQTTFFNTYLMD